MQFKLLIILSVILASIFYGDVCDAVARTIRVPLTRGITQEAGQYGQPIVNYYTAINIGTPAKRFNIQFDVALSEMFVPHYEWSPFKRNLHYGSGYQCKVSTTCKKDDTQLVVEYQHCKLTGKRYEDELSFVSAQGNNTPTHVFSWRQNFLALSDASDSRFKDLPIDGYFGLSAAQQSPSSISNILVAMHKAKLIDNLQFALWFNPVLDSTQGGELILGGVDPSRYQGQIYWHHLGGIHSQQWAIGLQYVSLGQQVVSCAGQNCQAVLSSGLSDIYGPRDSVQQIYSLLNSSVQQPHGLQLIDCRRIANLPVLTFFMDGIPYSMLPSNYIRKTVDGKIFKKETCYVAILPSDDGNRQWLLGTNFLGAFYTMYDMTYRQIGFAALKQ